MAQPRAVLPLKLFLSYSHRDEDLCEKFLVHLSQLKRDGLIEPWHDRRITAGSEWAGAIDDHLNSAHIIILLVSADFLASDYCNDIEMTRALERSRKGEAHVVAAILKPCDWETSRFAKLQALPKGGKPVVDWPTPDHGFLDAVKGLRRLIAELSEPEPAQVQAVQITLRTHPWRWIGGVVLVVILIACLWLWSSSRRYLRQGTDLLNVGLYSAARQPLELARRLNPFSRKTGCGLAAVELDATRYDPGFEQRLAEANQRYSNCAYLRLLTGDQKYRAGDRDGALAEYREAIQREPQLAEAYFNTGRILELKGDVDSALPLYEKAVQRSPGVARYHDNLGDLYFKLGDYDKALEQYGQVGEFPLSALEAARIYRLQGKLEDARGREEDAIDWLQDPRVQSSEKDVAWALDVSPVEQVRLALLQEKQCYAQLELFVTMFLQRDQAKASAGVPAVFEKCRSRQAELRKILDWELHRLGSELAKYTQPADDFTSKFLEPSDR
ncbi:MAG: toll/interleukin-1 receptor domain-containing protein [Acidobacteriaceae bacterium]|nr:toll/interleukin-1 receptor domain-containing protein [Acidobacteriaceae bacterium]